MTISDDSQFTGLDKEIPAEENANAGVITRSSLLTLTPELEDQFWAWPHTRDRLCVLDGCSRVAMIVTNALVVLRRPGSADGVRSGLFVQTTTLLILFQILQLLLLLASRHHYYRHRTQLLLLGRLLGILTAWSGGILASREFSSERQQLDSAPPLGLNWWLMLNSLIFRTGALAGCIAPMCAPLHFRLALLDSLAFSLAMAVTVARPATCTLILEHKGAHTLIRQVAHSVRCIGSLGLAAVSGASEGCWGRSQAAEGLLEDAHVLVFLVQLVMGLAVPVTYVFVTELRAKRMFLAQLPSRRRPVALASRCLQLPWHLYLLLPALLCLNLDIIARVASSGSAACSF